MHPMLNIAVKAARRAGTFINQASLNIERMSAMRKFSDKSLSEIDIYSGKIIREVLSASYPDHSIFIGEKHQISEKTEYRWVIDPLSNKNDFFHDFPSYAISIALEKKEQVVLSVVFDPSRNELFTASRGDGTFLNGRRIRVSGRSIFQESLLGTNANSLFLIENLGKLFQEFSSIRCIGSSNLTLSYVACGRLDGFFCKELKVHCLIAGILIIQEAGGLIADFDGNQKWNESGNVIAATPKILNNILNVFNV